jgi:hypothetical protein
LDTDQAGTFFYDAFVLAVMAPTHSAGDCKPKMDPRTGITFKACLDPVEVFAFML